MNFRDKVSLYITSEMENNYQVLTHCSVMTEAGKPAFLFFFKLRKKVQQSRGPFSFSFSLVFIREKQEEHFYLATWKGCKEPLK